MTSRAMAENYLGKARRALAAARLLLGSGDTEGACNRAYYAMHDAAHAALLAAGIEDSAALVKTHAGLISTFAQRLVKPGIVGVEQGRALGQVQKFRLLADYTADAPAKSDAAQAVALAERFVAAMVAAVGA